MEWISVWSWVCLSMFERGEREEKGKDATGEAVGWKQAVACMCVWERETKRE